MVDYQRLRELSIADVTGRIPAYLHIPFCAKHCWYCDFNVYERLGGLVKRYCEALIQEIENTSRILGKRLRVGTVYVGGGTPSLIGGKLLSSLLETLARELDFRCGVEATVEANPSNVTMALLSTMMKAGYRRLSIGGQSMSDRRLLELDRLHTCHEILVAVDRARAAGFPSVSVDLLYGAPRQTLSEFANGLKEVLDRDVDHISAYALTLDSERAVVAGQTLGGAAPDELMADFYDTAVEILGDAGFEHYEVSNWARPGHRCQYNESVWRGSEYLAFGCGAHGYLGARRFSIIREPLAYIDAIADGRTTVACVDPLDAFDRCVEAIAFPLRMREGIDLPTLNRRFAFNLAEKRGTEIKELVAGNLASFSDGRLALTDAGMIVADMVTLRLLPRCRGEVAI